ncbi:hypothetical protein AAMO2058_000763300 [Amorphochlora amoebiformis]|uniref:Aldehyde dehydrogenase domain-containing protein n=2 Tax=Amorphochlora amoebiformis TaxID=1561963 RepID=A0A7S0DRJ1_9EUKA|mmetsp:Transcript_7016/g.10863  ORF Transcript_7016/g.10863 Transcript_7016/m.10863 type:complete len:443 (+) Transcript_7016:243-1571(+)
MNDKTVLGYVDASASVQASWKNVPLAERLDMVEKALDQLLASKEKIAKDVSGMMGKPLNQAMGEVDGAIDRARVLCSLAPEALADDLLPEKENFFRKIAREPVGVVLVLAPWNYPLLTAINALIPAILSGNSVLLKHSERSPLCADHFASAFEKAGGPSGLVRALHTGHDEIASVIKHPKIGFVSFTGSVPGGSAVYQSVASRFIDTTLELGGKDGAYVAPDANLDAAVETLVDGGFYNAGQSCCGIERVYVHDSLYDDFITKATDIVNGYVLGDPSSNTTTLGPMAQPSSIEFLSSQVNDAKEKGALVLTGGQSATDDKGMGRFFRPTLLADCNHSMDVMKEESFGPVLGVMPVKSDDEAVKLMNDAHYGLTGVLFTENKERADMLAPQIEAGTVFMNRCDFLDPELPWTGVKDTGKGVSLSKHGFRAFSRLKSYHFKLTT